MNKRIGVIRGDGIGPKVVDEALRTVFAAGAELDMTDYDLGGERYLRDGTLLPDEIIDQWRDLGALLLGAVGTPPITSETETRCLELKPGTVEKAILIRARQELDMYVNLRPCKNEEKGFDMIFVRENTEGLYAGKGSFINKGTPDEIAIQESVNTRHGVERCIRYAFELAESRDRKLLTYVHKTNVLEYAGDLWKRTFEEVKDDYPNVDSSSEAYHNVDAAGIHLVDSPERYDVVVTDNMFGDILTDFADALSGDVGSSASANLNPERTGPSMFEPVHGTAPDIAGSGTANPLAAIRSAGMLLEFLGDTEASERIERACQGVNHSGSTKETTNYVIARL